MLVCQLMHNFMHPLNQLRAFVARHVEAATAYHAAVALVEVVLPQGAAMAGKTALLSNVAFVYLMRRLCSQRFAA